MALFGVSTMWQGGAKVSSLLRALNAIDAAVRGSEGLLGDSAVGAWICPYYQGAMNMTYVVIPAKVGIHEHCPVEGHRNAGKFSDHRFPPSRE